MATQPDQIQTQPLEREALLQQARERAGLADFGDEWFFEPMDHYIEASNREGRLTPAGRASTTEVIVKGLVSRLRMVEDIKRHPEILDEKVDVAGIILGLPRTGSTIFQRLLASAPGMTGLRWYEAQNFAPFPGEERGNSVERRAYAQAMIDGWLQLSPELASIHPLEPDAPDEEILVLGQMFVSTMIEGMNYVPSFTRWLNGYDQSKGHEDLKTILKYLQWQDPSRKGRKWILKSPSNLPYAEVAAKAFPNALLIMTHRDPLQTVPSYVSMQAALYKLSATLTDAEVGAFWFPRLVEWMRMFEAARERIGEDRFIDIDYREVGKEPMAQAERVLSRMGIPVDAQLEEVLAEFLAGNKREQRPMHDYSLERFGLDEEAIKREFAAYRERYIL
ncbi:MAG TPA: sulfotransferase [Sphingobium sp.]|nr:sulfotransferase [Sphingobium sp.]